VCTYLVQAIQTGHTTTTNNNKTLLNYHYGSFVAPLVTSGATLYFLGAVLPFDPGVFPTLMPRPRYLLQDAWRGRVLALVFIDEALSGAHHGRVREAHHRVNLHRVVQRNINIDDSTINKTQTQRVSKSSLKGPERVSQGGPFRCTNRSDLNYSLIIVLLITFHL